MIADRLRSWKQFFAIIIGNCLLEMVIIDLLLLMVQQQINGGVEGKLKGVIIMITI